MFYDIHSFCIIYQDSNISDVVYQMLKSEFRLEQVTAAHIIRIAGSKCQGNRLVTK